MKDYIIIDKENDVYFDLLTSSLFFKKLYDNKDRLKFYKTYTTKRQEKQTDRLLNVGHKKITTINLIPSYRCDGRCVYCYNKDTNNTITPEDLTLNSVKENIKKLKADGYDMSNITSVRLYGGEPLLNKELYDILMYLHELYKPIVHISSGLLVSDEYFNNYVMPLLLKLTKNNLNFSITTTLDFGSTPYTRLYKDPSVDSYNLLLKRMQHLLECNIKVVYATVVNKNTDIDLLKEQLISTYNSVIKYNNEFDINILSTENISRLVAFRISIANDDNYYPSLEKIDQLYNVMKELYKNYPIVSNLYPYTDVVCGCQLLKAEDDVYTFLYPSTRCGIYTYMIEMFPDKMGACHMNLEDGNILFTKNSPVYDELLNTDRCIDCSYELICRKGCPYRMIYSPLANDSYCQWIRYSFELAWSRVYLLCNNNKEELKTYIEKHLNKKVII